MLHQSKLNEDIMDNHKHFNNELKLFINEKLFEKKVISEQMYYKAKEVLIKQGN